MLGPLEQLLRPGLAAALPPGQDLQTGPAPAPGGTASRVVIHARRLVQDDPNTPDERPSRDPAFQGWQGTLAATPEHPLDFILPDDAPGDLTEVHCPPGRVLAAGDAYLLDGRTLRFFRAPPGPVLARTRGAPCAGYQERRNSRIDLELQAWARDMSTADDLLARALAAVLATVSGLDVIDLSSAPPHLSLRLTAPRVSLAGIERNLDPDNPERLHCVAHCLIRGELETSLILGEPDPQGRISEVDVALHLPSRPPSGG